MAVGLANFLNPDDRVFSNHRGHSHYISVGGDIEKLFAEVLGKSTQGVSGMGGSMHLVDRSAGFTDRCRLEGPYPRSELRLLLSEMAMVVSQWLTLVARVKKGFCMSL